MAQRVLESAANDGKRIDLAYLLTLGRAATTLERERSLGLISEVHAGLEGTKEADRDRLAWATLCQSLFATAEFRYLD
ncbi:MAG: hypothetical protein GWO24_25415 [Akkermansiaceae bacterium]|nr:hypothetical protein [Akkermansiaceae bacterium]